MDLIVVKAKNPELVNLKTNGLVCRLNRRHFRGGRWRKLPALCLHRSHVLGFSGSHRESDNMRRIFLVIFALTALASQADAQQSGDSRKGEALATSVCAQCHAVKAGQLRSPNPKAPSFSSVAKRPETTDMALRVWLQSPHSTMPNFILSGDDTNNIVAYILSLNAENSKI